MKVCIYSNCQGDGIAHFMRKADSGLDIKVHHNWQILMGETSAEDLMRDAKACDAFIYQPTSALKHGMLSTDEMVADVVPESAVKLSFPYVFNTGFFPIVKHGRWWTGKQVFEAANRGDDIVAMYDTNQLKYDCAERMEENFSEQEQREKCCDLKFVPWMRENYRRKHLFLLCNHPGSDMLIEMARRVYEILTQCEMRVVCNGPNDAGLPGYHAVHPAVVSELGLEFAPDRRGEDANYYRILMMELMGQISLRVAI